MRSRIAYSLAAGCLLLTLASLALWAVSLWRIGWVGYQSTAAGTTTYRIAGLEWGLVAYVHGSGPSRGTTAFEGWRTVLAPSQGPDREGWANWSIDQEEPTDFAPSRITRVALAGFGMQRTKGPLETETTVHFPLWFTAAVPAFLAYRLFRRARRIPTPGLCPRCGYDVRVQHAGEGGSRCPECGMDLVAARGPEGAQQKADWPPAR